jgi:hypothetical protein
MRRSVPCNRRSEIWKARTPAIIATKRNSRPVRFATLSDGRFFTPLDSFRRHENALARAQRSLSRKTKYSRNWRKEKARVQRIYARIANARADYLHKISSTISQNHAVVFVEDLRVSAMSQSDSAPGKRRLNKSILDQGWFEFRRQSITSCDGTADDSSPYRPATRALLARVAGTSGRRIDSVRLNSSVWHANTRRMQTWSVPSTY